MAASSLLRTLRLDKTPRQPGLDIDAQQTAWRCPHLRSNNVLRSNVSANRELLGIYRELLGISCIVGHFLSCISALGGWPKAVSELASSPRSLDDWPPS